MNLLTDSWIPVREQANASVKKLTLEQLLCEDGKWELCLPRDDMEMATLQMLICLAQVLFVPSNKEGLKQRIQIPLKKNVFEQGVREYGDWFFLDHPHFPFMQVRGVRADKTTPFSKLLTGLDSTTNCCFVNEPGLGEYLCGSCACIALFNQASCSPSFGGGFKSNLRDARWPGKDKRGGLSGVPITTLVQGSALRQTVWMNVLSEERLAQLFPWYTGIQNDEPTWVRLIKEGEKIPVHEVGLIRGLFWQPTRVELVHSKRFEKCSCCGEQGLRTYSGFKKEQLRYTVLGVWPHPHSPRFIKPTPDGVEESFVSFNAISPSWTQLGRFVIQRQVDGNQEGQEPAAVIRQAKSLLRDLRMNVGGYANQQAKILKRRHEVITLPDGWSDSTDIINNLIMTGLNHLEALKKALRFFSKGTKKTKVKNKIKGVGVPIYRIAEEQFYRRTEDTVLDTLARIDFNNPTPYFLALQDKLQRVVRELFEELVRPYLSDPNLIHTMAISRRVLHKHLNALKPQQEEIADGKSN